MNQPNILSTFFENTKIYPRYVYFHSRFSLLFISCEQLKRAHDCFFGFFRTLIKDRIYILSLLVFGIAYFIHVPDNYANLIFKGALNIFNFAIAPSLLILPAFVAIQRSRNIDGLAWTTWIACALIGCFGFLYFISALFGLEYFPQSVVYSLMISIFFDFLIICVMSIVIYILFLIVDSYFYPSESLSPLNYRTIVPRLTINYANCNYAIEALILLFIIATYSPAIEFLYLTSSNTFESVFLYLGQKLLRNFVHGGTFHLVLNSVALYSSGKIIAKKQDLFI